MKQLGAVAAATAFGSKFGHAQSVLSPTLGDLFFAAGFDPEDALSTTIAVITDVHIDVQRMNTLTIDDRIVDTINGMSPRPEFLVINGDLATSHSPSAGEGRRQRNVDAAIEELTIGLQQVERFDASIDVRIIPGNHDTDAAEVTPDVWNQVLVGVPAYQHFEVSGVDVIMLNGGHDGELGQVQHEWLEGVVDGIASDREIVIFVHQPGMGRVERERGIKRSICDAFAGHQGLVWMICGHDHRFANNVFHCDGLNIVQTQVTTANPQAFSDGRNPGFMLLCLHDGQVAARIFRDLNEPDFELLPAPSFGNATPVSFPFEAVSYPLLTLEEGSYSAGDYVTFARAAFTGSWWAYVDHLVYRIPLSLHGGKASRVLLLMRAKIAANLVIRLSNGGVPVEVVPPPLVQGVYEIPIPEALRSGEWIDVDISCSERRYSTEITVGGFGLSAALDDLTMLEQWMSSNFKTIFNSGNAAIDANPSGDGLSNLQKYAFGLDPQRCDRRKLDLANPGDLGLPLGMMDGADPLLCYVRRRQEESPGIVYTAEVSHDHDLWGTDEALVSEVTWSEGAWELVQVTYQAVGANRSTFLRVRVDLVEELLTGT